MKVKLDKTGISTPNYVRYIVGDSKQQWIAITDLSDDDLDEMAKEYRFTLYEKRDLYKNSKLPQKDQK